MSDILLDPTDKVDRGQKAFAHGSTRSMEKPSGCSTLTNPKVFTFSTVSKKCCARATASKKYSAGRKSHQVVLRLSRFRQSYEKSAML